MEKSLKEKIDMLVAEKEDEKKAQFKLPLSVRIFGKAKVKQNNAIFVLIRTNGTVVIKMLPIEDDTIKFGGVYYDANAGYVLKYKKWPMIVQPEWNMKPINSDEVESEGKPFSSEENFKAAIEEGTLSSAEKVIINKIYADAVKSKMQLNGTTIAIIIAVIVGGLWLANSQGWL